MVPFHPRPPWLTGRLQTLRALRWPVAAALPEGHRLWLPMADGDALAAMLHFPVSPRRLPLAVLVHGLTGSEDDPYLREAARGLLRRGFRVLRLNLRGSAASLPRSTSHYHLGRSEDLAQAMAALPSALTTEGVVIAGWSLGGRWRCCCWAARRIRRACRGCWAARRSARRCSPSWRMQRSTAIRSWAVPC